MTFWFAPPAAVAASRESAAAAGAPTIAEKYLLDQVAAGKVADFNTAFPDEGARAIRGIFLEELLTGSRKDCIIHRNGVQVEGAVVREAVDLRNAEIARATQLVRCRFEGSINFSRSIFHESLSVEGSVFQGPANFSEMKVSRGFNFQKAVFKQSANFEQLEVAGVLQAGGVAFEDENGTVTFNNLKAGSAVCFTNALFAGAVDFKLSRVAGDLKFDRARFTHSTGFVSFEELKVEGSTSFSQAEFAGYTSLKDSRFNALDVTDAKWPVREYGQWLWLNGVGYQRISAGEERSSSSNLLALVNRAAHGSAYSSDIYSSLAEFYRREGYPREANQFLIAQKRRERDEALHGMAWGWSLFLDWFVGYGRSPQRALVWSIAIVLVGMLVFRPHRMEPRTTNLKTDFYSPLWYSVDLFLPLIKLQDAELWKPRDDFRFARFWSRLHTMLGWALIPIALAAWTGMLGP
ncbi:MAG: pentapeptide repeat-containing protein [Akkermansiaceae bacterium]|nr:pentapeptide repeat-containing protein [Verrucomicrobiales bacterium]